MLVHDAFSSLGVTAAIGAELLASRQWRYIGRSRSLAEYRREPVLGWARIRSAARQLGEVPWFVRNLIASGNPVFPTGVAGLPADESPWDRFDTPIIKHILDMRTDIVRRWIKHVVTWIGPASLFGLVDRGTLRPGAHADVVVFDPDTIGSEPATLVEDLPGGSARLTAGSYGIVRVMVNGEAVVVDGEGTGAVPGRLLRSGRDTATVATR